MNDGGGVCSVHCVVTRREVLKNVSVIESRDFSFF